jgi:Winged helix DNA-binding domain
VAATRHSDALAVGTVSQAKRIYRPQGWLTPVVCVDGRFAGVWKHERLSTTVAVEVETFERRPPAALRAGVEAEAPRLAAFLGGTLDLRWI